MEIVKNLPHELQFNVIRYLSTPTADLIKNIDYKEEFKKMLYKEYFSITTSWFGFDRQNVFGRFNHDFILGGRKKTTLITFDKHERDYIAETDKHFGDQKERLNFDNE